MASGAIGLCGSSPRRRATSFEGRLPIAWPSRITVPTFGFYKLNGTWGVEGHGVDPDIQVIDDPALMVNGGDPQLDRAIKQMMDEIAQSPYVAPKRPASPEKAGMGMKDEDK